MCDLVARTGRHLQRYENGRRLVAGCIPFRYRDINDEASDDEQKKLVEVLMISSQSGPGLLFPKGGWENDETVEEAAAREAIEEAGVRGDLVQLLGFYDFKSKQPEAMCRAAIFALHVKEELASWPEQNTRQRSWLTVPEAAEQSRYPWMQEALVTGFSAWLENWRNGGGRVDRSEYVTTLSIRGAASAISWCSLCILLGLNFQNLTIHEGSLMLSSFVDFVPSPIHPQDNNLICVFN